MNQPISLVIRTEQAMRINSCSFACTRETKFAQCLQRMKDMLAKETAALSGSPSKKFSMHRPEQHNTWICFRCHLTYQPQVSVAILQLSHPVQDTIVLVEALVNVPSWPQVKLGLLDNTEMSFWHAFFVKSQEAVVYGRALDVSSQTLKVVKCQGVENSGKRNMVCTTCSLFVPRRKRAELKDWVRRPRNIKHPNYMAKLPRFCTRSRLHPVKISKHFAIWNWIAVRRCGWDMAGRSWHDSVDWFPAWPKHASCGVQQIFKVPVSNSSLMCKKFDLKAAQPRLPVSKRIIRAQCQACNDVQPTEIWNYGCLCNIPLVLHQILPQHIRFSAWPPKLCTPNVFDQPQYQCSSKEFYAQDLHLLPGQSSLLGKEGVGIWYFACSLSRSSNLTLPTMFKVRCFTLGWDRFVGVCISQEWVLVSWWHGWHRLLMSMFVAHTDEVVLVETQIVHGL